MDDKQGFTLFVGNLHSSVTKEILLELFTQAGPVLQCQIPKDHSGRNRSYGFVSFKYYSSCAYAVKIFRGTRLFGKELSVNERTPRHRHDNR